LRITRSLRRPAAAHADLHGKWGAENKKVRIKLNLSSDPAGGSLRLKGKSDADTVGHLYDMECRKRGGKNHLVFSIQPITGSNPINLYGASDVRGRICTITVDGARLTRLTLKRR
jgi:hypothetical protein